jgi:hypothetical protein
MYTFVFMAHLEDKLSEGFLRDCARITKKWMPALGLELKESYAVFPECNSGWFWLAPAFEMNSTYISEVVGQRYAVIVFGDIFDGGSHSAAQTVFDAWVSGGSSKVRELEGCFSSVILDRTDGAVVLIGDKVGRRALSYYADNRALIVSPHDVALMATGCCPVEFDYVSICSVPAVGWSLRGRSLLKHIYTCRPAEYIQWADGQIQLVADPVLEPDQRILEGDVRAISRHLDHMIETARGNARIFAANQPEIKCDLSAGFDSRVTLSLLLSVIDDPSRIIATSTGEANCQDVRVACQIAKMYRTRFLSFVDVPPSPDDFVERCDLLAFHVNGGTDSVRAMKYPPEFTRQPKTYACGAGGEMFRGRFYPQLPFESRDSLSPADASQFLRKITKIDKLPWKSPELAEAVLARLNAVVDEYATFSNNGYDILDMFYLNEQRAVWGAVQVRQTWKDPRWSPFISTQLIRMALMMPAPIGKYAAIHRESLRRFAPKAYWVRINGKRLLPLEGGGNIKRLLRGIDSRYQYHLGRMLRLSNRGRQISKSKSTAQLAIDLLAGPLMEPVREIVMSEGSFGLEVFGRRRVELLLNEHALGTHNHIRVLGYLVPMERWRAMVQGAARDAGAG